ncbi:helix-turn-helix domain-containing protein [Polaromonas glacialis]|uniref:helix-turn-helix domain-containing protein n=1 Tax=Polaromonas glacialis TaxID=866564 RepID=UPI00055F6F9A|nr:helix-turn-helix transcriptional regulator [Polaromonas glacialis]
MNRIAAFGQAVRNCRKAQGLSQEALAEKADLHTNYVSLVERGLSAPALDTICALADALGLSVSDLALQMEAHAKRSPDLGYDQA